MPYFCYLLVSCNAPSTCYVGFTKTPRRRLRQHNGEITAGAWKTHKHRPWKHVGIVSGFPNGIVALQFEWQWQHAKKVRILKEYQGKKRGGSPAMLAVLAALLSTPLWKRLNLVVHFLDADKKTLFDALLSYPSASVLTTNAEIDRMHLTAEQPTSHHQTDLPCQICQQVEATMTTSSSSSSSRSVNARRMWCCLQASCPGYRAHLLCMSQQQQAVVGRGDATVTASTVIPSAWQCGQCGVTVPWSQCVMRSYYNGSDNHNLEQAADDDEDDDEDDDDFEECPGKRSRNSKAAMNKNSGKRAAVEVNLLSDEDEEEEGAGEIIVVDDSDDDEDDGDDQEDEDDDVFR